MLFALGAASSQVDLLKLLTSLRTSTTASAASGEVTGNSLDLADMSSSPDSAAPGFRYSLPGHGISSGTMEACWRLMGQSGKDWIPAQKQEPRAIHGTV